MLNFKAISRQRALILAWLISSFAFGAFHLDNPNATLVSTVNISLGGITLPAKTVTFIQTAETGPDLWTGGKFGPEAGLVGLLSMILGVAATLVWVKLRYGRVAIQHRLATWSPAELTQVGHNDGID